MKTRFFVLLLTFMLFMAFPTNATKIQLDDTWTYIDQNDVKYNETASEIIVLTSGETPITVVKTFTNRSFAYDLNFYGNENFSTDINLGFDGLYLTQEGAIPFIPFGINLTGFVNTTISLPERVVFDMKDMDLTWSWTGGSPASALLTTDSIEYELKAEITLKEFGLYDWGFKYEIFRSYLISSNSDIEDTTKNFTVTEMSNKFLWGTSPIPIIEDPIAPNITLSLTTLTTAMLLSYETGINQPVYIAQTEPVKTEGLSLSQLSGLVEYYLFKEDIDIIESSSSITDTTDITNITTTPFLFISGFIIFIIFRRFKSQ